MYQAIPIVILRNATLQREPLHVLDAIDLMGKRHDDVVDRLEYCKDGTVANADEIEVARRQRELQGALAAFDRL